MKDYRISYCLGDMYHTYIVTQPDEATAIMKALQFLPEGSRKLLHDFKIERYYEVWN